jgi:PAS domain S-box-containing protein
MAQADHSESLTRVAPIRNWSRPILRVCGLVAFGIAVLGLIGWFGDIALLKSILPALPPMKPNCAIGLGLAAVAVVLASQSDRPRFILPTVVLALIAGVIGLATLLQYQWRLEAGIDNLLSVDIGPAAAGNPGRLSVAAALELVLLGIAVPCVTFPRTWTRLIVWVCSLLGLLVAFFAIFFTILAIFYDPESLYTAGLLSSVALHAGLGFFILFCSLLLWGCRDSLRLPLVSLALLALAPLAAVMIYFALAERRAALETSRARVADRAHLLATGTDDVVDDARRLLHMISEARTIGAGTGPSSTITAATDCEKFLTSLLQIHSWVRQLRISDPDGNAICATDQNSEAINIADRSYFADAIRQRAFSVSGLLMPRASRQPRLFAALPLIENGAIVGVASLSIDLSVFGDLIGRIGLEPGEMAAIISRGGIVFANRPQPPDLTGTRLIDAPIVKRALSAGAGKSTEPDWEGRERLFAFAPITDTGAIVLVGLYKQTVTEAIDRTLRARVMLLTLIMIATAIASLLGGELLVFGPVRKLARRATLIEQGDFRERLNVSGIGEIWTLYNAFIRMRDAIADRERRLGDALVRHQAVFDSAIDGIITINESGSIESLNPAAERLFGYSAEALLHRHIMVLLPSGDAHEGSHPIRDLRRALLGIGQVREIDARRADGRTFPADVALSEMRLGARRVIVAIVRDASERKRVDRMKNEFVSTVSHELRTPLTSIAGSLGLLSGGAGGTLSDTAQRLISIAHRNSQRLIRLINDILDLEKIAAGKLTFAHAPVAMREVAAEAIEANQAYAQEHGVSVVLEPGSVDSIVVGDRDRLMQVVTNLLSNAIKFSSAGGTVRVSIAPLKDMIRLSVADNGPGIPVEFRERVFMKFAQADTSDTRSKGGTGLGLAVAKELVERHDGRLSFETQVGRGTVFHVDLPAAETQTTSAGDESAGEILIVEDDRDTAEVLRDMLARSGFSVALAATAKDAEAKAGNPAMRVVLVDLGLPDRDGISLIRSLRANERTRRIPIIVVTARKRDAAGAAEADALEVLDWIEKPVDPVRLRAALETAVGPSGSARILHVEDDPDVRQLVAQSLAHAGEIHSVATLAKATAAITTLTFDVVILDMTLPDGSGTELLPFLKNRAGDPIPVIVFSARSTDPDIAHQVQAVLTKSQNSLEHLVKIVSRLCRSANTRQGEPAAS